MGCSAKKTWLVSVLWCVIVFGLSLSGCATGDAGKQREQSADSIKNKEMVAESQDEQVQTKPVSFCPEGQSEHKRDDIQWCSLGEKIHGPFAVFASDGELLMKGGFVDNQLHGDWVGYYATGTKRWTVHYDRGEEQGTLKAWYPNGELHFTIGYRKGKRDGVGNYFYPSGADSARVEYRSGKRVGTWTFWHENGQKSHELSYGQDEQESIHKHWDDQGKAMDAPLGTLSSRKVRRVVEDLQDDVVACYEQARTVDPSQGKIVAQFIVDYSGDVTQVSTFESDFEHNFMQKCTRRMVESLQFPKNPYGPKTIIKSYSLAVQ